jgi:hypothetical protein
VGLVDELMIVIVVMASKDDVYKTSWCVCGKLDIL